MEKELEKQWIIDLNPTPADKKSFWCKIKMHSWKQFTHLRARQTLYKCIRCGDEAGRRQI